MDNDTQTPPISTAQTDSPIIIMPIEMKPELAMEAANYNLIDTELGPALDISITVRNIGNAAGSPEQFEIELIDDQAKQLIYWPMIANGAMIQPASEQIYRTRLIEPPANFSNIRVTMQK